MEHNSERKDDKKEACIVDEGGRKSVAGRCRLCWLSCISF